MADLAETLERLAGEGPAGFYRGDLARRIARRVRERGGRITEADLAAYSVIVASPCGPRIAGTSSSRIRRRRPAAC